MREAPEVVNPFPPTGENLIAGGKIYLNECSKSSRCAWKA